MGGTGEQIAVTVVVTAAVIGAATGSLLTLWRARSRDRRRAAWLSANAQPRLTAAVFAFNALLGIGGAVACALAARAGYPFLWAPAALFAGILVSSIISWVTAFRMPKDVS